MTKEKALIFLADGFEEVEAITPIDLLRRAGIEVTTASVNNKIAVMGAHNISITCDVLLQEITAEDFTIFIVPGGPGHTKLAQNQQVCDLLVAANKQKRLIAAICAAPSILGNLDILIDKKACCFPGYEEQLSCKEIVMNHPTVTDENIITSRGAGTAFLFAIAIVEKVLGKQKAQKLMEQTVYMQA